MTGLLFVLMAAAQIPAQMPDKDARAVNLPGTNTQFPLPTFTSLAAWEMRKIKLRRQILSAAGLDPMPERTPLHPQIFGRVVTKDCTIDKVLIETMPGYYVGGNLYRPLNATERAPAVLNPHGHWTYGRLENQPLYSGPQFGMNLARQGYVVFAWDMVGYNDTIQTPHAFGDAEERQWAFGPYGLQLWNALRALDFVAALPDVDPARIAMAGASGGATQTISLAAIDDRIAAYAPVNMVSRYMQGGDYCENAPGLRIGTNNVEIAAMIAPKPLLLVSATGDWTKNTPIDEYPAIRRIYELYGKPENVRTLQLDAPHNFNKENREAIYRFLAANILHAPDAAKIVEKNASVEMLQNMLALTGRSYPPNALTYRQLFEQWKKRPTAPSRESLLQVLGAEWPDEVINDATALSRPSAHDRVEAIFAEGKGMPILIVGGTRNDIPAGRPGLAITLFHAPRDQSIKHFLTFNHTDDQCRIQDALTALAWLHAHYPGTIELTGIGQGSLIAEYAAKIAPIPTKPTSPPSMTYPDIPGIRLALQTQ